jgi:hypothetical protein
VSARGLVPVEPHDGAGLFLVVGRVQFWSART